jgi:hypothetical protein
MITCDICTALVKLMIKYKESGKKRIPLMTLTWGHHVSLYIFIRKPQPVACTCRISSKFVQTSQCRIIQDSFSPNSLVLEGGEEYSKMAKVSDL